ncbi:MAG: hypothetical protein ACJAUH_000832 [Saprospiraceae bacterium]
MCEDDYLYGEKSRGEIGKMSSIIGNAVNEIDKSRM